jgi:PPP family 3-phenylpropionic acid transporter
VRSLQLLYLLFGALVGVLFPFVSVILETRGFSAAEIGVVLSLTAVAYTAVLPAWGHVGDVVLGRRRTLQAAAVGTGLSALWFGAPLPAVFVAAGLVACSVLQSGLGMLADAVTVNALADRPDRFGRYRLIASAAFAVSTVAAGLLFDRAGYQPAFLLAAALGLLMGAGTASLPDAPRARLSDYAAGPGRRLSTRWFGSLGTAVRISPRLMGVMVAVVLVNLGVVASFTFLPLRLVEIGGAPSVIALSAALSAVFEIPSMLAASRVAGRVGLRGLFAIGCLSYGVAFATWVVLAEPGLIVASRVFTGIGYGSMTVSAVLTVGALLPDRLQASGQALYAMSAMGIAAILANLAGGFVFGALGYGWVFGLGSAAALGAALVAWRYMPARGEVRIGARG